MESQYETTMKALAAQRKEARASAQLIDRAIKKQKKAHRALVKKLKGLSSQQLYEAAERARAAEGGSAGAASSV